MANKPGPKTPDVHGEDLERVTLTLDAMTRRRLRVLGGTNESAGARVAARVAYQQYQRDVEGRRAAWPAMDGAALVRWLVDASGDDQAHPAGQAALMLKRVRP